MMHDVDDHHLHHYHHDHDHNGHDNVDADDDDYDGFEFTISQWRIYLYVTVLALV